MGLRETGSQTVSVYAHWVKIIIKWVNSMFKKEL